MAFNKFLDGIKLRPYQTLFRCSVLRFSRNSSAKSNETVNRTWNRPILLNPKSRRTVEILITMTTTRKAYSPAFKAQIVQELLKEGQTMTQIASKNGVHPTQLRRWRDAALKAMPKHFGIRLVIKKDQDLSKI
ncbi:MAG: transposase [Chloroflexi bacterium]|uniref:Transposase n=1 Tax=Candidatus Chlorohelix allophototropha TaxID=3003348 RepID=A0A8T7LXE4_9CHLR|nr:transposase [Chloroflexota bacterium]WJW66004.1 transposase [Chloroflexota bacterium L227-S17]